MKLSIITINYNNRDGLQKTIDSVVNQTWRDFEWIIIDGGSTDGSRELIEKYQEHFAYWCSEPDKGVYNAMNKGIAKAQGEYMNFMNSGDCFYEKDTLQKVFSTKREADILYGNVNCITNCNNYFLSYPKELSTPYFLYRGLCHQASFIKTSLLKDKKYCEDFKIVSDWQRFFEWFREGKTYKHIDLIIADFDTTGISETLTSRHLLERNMVCEELFGKENMKWVSESILLQEQYDKTNNDDVKRILNIKAHGGKRYEFTRFFMRFIIWTYRIEDMCGIKVHWK